MDAQTLISRCKAGERQALHLLYEQYRPRLLSICRQYAKGDNVSEDLLHDAFVIILTSLDQLRNDDKLTLSRQLTSRLSIETGFSYTQMKSTVTTGSTTAYIQEHQRLHYLGIPLRLGWQWYNKAHLSLYSSTGIMLELPIRSTLNIKHVANDIVTFGKKTTHDVPCQWSTSFGIGIQYDVTPHLGIYMEPSLQYFFHDGSDLKSYRTEHPLNITLPLGIRFHW